MRIATLILLLGMSAVPTSPADAFCYEEAGNRYGISQNHLYAISNGESSFNPIAINYYTNGSYDFGLMQINSSWERRHASSAFHGAPSPIPVPMSWSALGYYPSVLETYST